MKVFALYYSQVSDSYISHHLLCSFPGIRMSTVLHIFIYIYLYKNDSMFAVAFSVVFLLRPCAICGCVVTMIRINNNKNICEHLI